MTDFYGTLAQPPPPQPQAPQPTDAAPTSDFYGPVDMPPSPQAWGEWIKSVPHDIIEPALRSAASSATFGLWDRARALPDVITGDKTYDQAVNDQVAALQAGRERLGPMGSSVADIAGGAALGTGLAKAGITFMGDTAVPLLRRIGLSALEGMGYGAAEGAGHTYSGNLPDYVQNATIGGAMGGVLGGVLPAAGAGASGAYKKISDAWSGIPAPVLKAGAADATGLANLHTLGPDAMLSDAGPSMQATAQAAVQGMGEHRTNIVNALMERDQATVPRLQADREAALGPAPPARTDLEAGLDAERKAINANDYAPVLQGRAMNPQGADQVISALDQLGQSKRIDLGDVKNALMLPGTQSLPDLTPQSWLQARRNVDSMITVATRTGDKYRAGVLQDARDLIDNELAANVPGIKAADAKFANNRAQLEALSTGQNVLDTGKNAMHPDDLANIMRVAPPMVNLRLRQGVHADIERRLGTAPNDLNAFERVLGTPEDWNTQKLRTVFGPDAAQSLADSVERNRQFRETYQRVAQGSDTGQRIASREDTGMLNPTELGKATAFGTMVLKPLAKAWEMFRGAREEEQRNAIARWMALRDPSQVAQAANDILAQNAKTARVGPLVDKYTRAAAQGGIAGGAAPFYTDTY